MRHNANLNIGDIYLEIEARMVTTANNIIHSIELTNIVITQATNAHGSCYTHLGEDVDAKAWVHIELCCEVAAARYIYNIATRCEARGATLNQELCLENHTHDATTVQAEVVAVEQCPREALVAKSKVRDAHALQAIGDKTKVEARIVDAAIDKLIAEADTNGHVIAVGICEEWANSGATQADIDVVKQEHDI